MIIVIFVEFGQTYKQLKTNNMKKEIKTYEELLKCNLKPFEAEFNDEKIFGTIKIDELGMRFELTEESKVKVGLSAFTGSKRWIESNFYNFRLSNFLYNILVEEWQPKFGELVEVSNGNEKWYQRIFVGEYAGNIHCIHDKDVDLFKLNLCESYRVLQWNFIRKIEEPKTIEISIEEAKEIIAKEKGITIEQVNLNFKII